MRISCWPALLFFLSFSLQSAEIADVFLLYKQGSYVKALETLEKVPAPTSKLKGTKYYLRGLIENKLQKYDSSIISFAQAEKLKNDSVDLYYQYGQALYANNDLEASQKAFKKSYLKKFKTGSSLYYIAHIFQLMEEHKQAKKIFERIIKEEKDDDSLLQASRYQLSESLLAMLEGKEKKAAKRIARKYILPQLKKAYEVDEGSDLAFDIQKRIKEVEKQYGLDPNLMINGKVLPKKRWEISASQGFKYDNNITQATDVPSSQATQKDSFVFDTSLQAKYIASFANRLVITPQVRIKKTDHSDDVHSDVYQNNSYQINSYLKNSFEHTMFSAPASILMDLEYTYIARDPYLQKKMNKYAYATGFTFGEKFRYFRFGDTSFKYKYKDYVAYQDTLNNKTVSLIADQIYMTTKGHIMLLMFEADFIDNYNDTNSSTDSYLFRVDYLIPEFFPRYMLTLTYAQTFLDTKLQAPTRGTEKTFAPSIKLSKTVNKFLNISLSYDYSKTTSLDTANYDYSKQVTTFEIQARF